MQKLKMSYVLLLGIFLSSCGSLPSKPKIEICGHDYVNNEAECFDNQGQTYRTIPMSLTDRYIMFSPDDWGLILIYLDKLERRLRRSKSKTKSSISTELKKIIDTSLLLDRQ